MNDLTSKSQKKRDAETLQSIGVEWTHLSIEKLNGLPISATLKQAIVDAKSLKSHGAMRRQAQLIGKLMRMEDMEAVLNVYEEIRQEDSAKTAKFHEVEQWRSRLLHEGKEALTQFVQLYQPNDVQQLRQLIKKAIDEETKPVRAGAGKALFRYLRSYLI